MNSRLKYSQWKKDNQTILEELSHKKLVVPFSGGKDSSVVLSLIHEASKEFDINFEAHGAIFPANVFSKDHLHVVNESVSMAEELVSEYYKMSASEWLRPKFDVKTRIDLMDITGGANHPNHTLIRW